MRYVWGVCIAALVIIVYGYWDKSRVYLVNDVKLNSTVTINSQTGFVWVDLSLKELSDGGIVTEIIYNGSAYKSGSFVTNVSGSCSPVGSNQFSRCSFQTEILIPTSQSANKNDPQVVGLSDEEWFDAVGQYEVKDKEVSLQKYYAPYRYIDWLDRGIELIFLPFKRI